MPYLCPPTLTQSEQKLILRATANHPRDHAIISMALLAQRFARHASPLTTTIYTHPSDDELQSGISALNC